MQRRARASRDCTAASRPLLVCGAAVVSLLTLSGVSKNFGGGQFWSRATARAVKDVSLSLEQNQTLGVVGESGSGKSTLLRLILRLLPLSGGEIRFHGQDVQALSGRALLQFRREVQPIFQDPASSFNPRQRIGQILSAPLEVHGPRNRRQRESLVAETLVSMGLPEDFMRRYPHQLSGGQKQRVAIARAVILKPALILADEPTSALDVSVQAQILNLFRETKRNFGLTTIFVSHNLAVIRYLSDVVAVMRQGEIVEQGPSEAVFSDPQHPYTRALLDAAPSPRPRRDAGTTEDQGGSWHA
jgi:ABC-type glutathione transport system ATPase component